MLGSSLQQYQQWPIGIWIHWLHYEYGVTHVLRDAEKLEELLYVYESCVNHIGEQKKDSVLSWQPLSPRYYQYIKWNTLPELQAFKGAKVSRPHPLSSKTDMHWCFEGLSNRIVHFSQLEVLTRLTRYSTVLQRQCSTAIWGITASLQALQLLWFPTEWCCEVGRCRLCRIAELKLNTDLRYLFQRLGERPETRGGKIANLHGLISVWRPCAASLLHKPAGFNGMEFKHICTASVMYRQNLDKFGK